MIIHGDCIEEMKLLEPNSVDAIVTDPPYGLSFMGKNWDKGVPAIPFWKEMIRVLKPGGFLLAFGGTRTYHRMACAIEDAGFEIRDCMQWLYGSGFPKSLNIGKQVDKMNGRNPKHYKKMGEYLMEKITDSDSICAKKIGYSPALVRFWRLGERIPNKKTWLKLKEEYNLNNNFDDLIEKAEAEREIIEKKSRTPVNDGSREVFGTYGKDASITKPNLPEAKEWEGWGTALKPANEPIVVARKPLSEKNVALNVLKWGTGGINIDACRIPAGDTDRKDYGRNKDIPYMPESNSLGKFNKNTAYKRPEAGRFPANIILDEEAGKILGEPSKFFYCAKASKSERNFGLCDYLGLDKDFIEKNNIKIELKNSHPTVKPIKLMEYLIKLVSRNGATVLDPFTGSGTTGIACIKLNRKFIGIEKEEEYVKIAKARIKPFKEQEKL